MVTSSRTTSAMRRSRTDFAAVSTALRAASAHPSVLVELNSVTRYTLSAMRLPSVGGSGGLLHLAPQHDVQPRALCRAVRVGQRRRDGRAHRPAASERDSVTRPARGEPEHGG